MMRKLVILMVTAALIACTGSRGSGSGATSGLSAHGTSTSVSPPRSNYDSAALVADLKRAGRRVSAVVHGVGERPFPGVSRTVLCLAGHPVHVYEYGTRNERRQWSRGIGADGSTIVSPGGPVSSVAWVGDPHFYARGRILVLALSASPSVRTLLDRVLGPTLTPHALGGRGGGAGENC